MLANPDTTTRWIDPTPIPADFNLGTLDANPLVARVLYQRGFRDAEAAAAFINPKKQMAPSPGGLPNIEAAIARVEQSLDNASKIAIFGDYDVDGVTSTVVLTQALAAMTDPDRVITFLPERNEGYGLNKAAIERVASTGADLLITVDCGSSNAEEITYAKSLGIDTIVLDHHQLPAGGPPPAIVVNPQLEPESPYRQLTAVGIAWLFITALAADGHPVANGTNENERAFLDLVALGTVADVAPLSGINRSLVRDGLAALRSTSRPGLQALVTSSQLETSAIQASDIAFRLGPRINAAGRLRSPKLAYDLLTTAEKSFAQELALQLETLNRERRIKTDQVIADARGLIQDQPQWEDKPILAVADPQWESGLLGLAASKLTEEYRRPVLIFREDNGRLHGSARSVSGFNLIEALQPAASLMGRFGGHSMAAGMELPSVNLPQLETILTQYAIASGIELPAPKILTIDADLDPADLDPRTVRHLERLEPFGVGNPQPLLRLGNAALDRYATIGMDNRHLRITVNIGNRKLEAILWSGAARSRELVMRRKVDLVGKLDLNVWNGRERLQMVLEDFRAL